MSYPTKLARVIEESDWTRYRLAKKLGVNRQTVGQWVAGKEKVPRARQAQIAVHLEVVPASIFGENGVALPDRQEA